MLRAWGDPADDPDVRDGAFRFRAIACGNAIVALPPDRGRRDAAARRLPRSRAAAPPCAGRPSGCGCATSPRSRRSSTWARMARWNGCPGKAVALTAELLPRSADRRVAGVYPFIVSNPGEAAQAKRRIAAVTIGHLPPPLIRAFAARAGGGDGAQGRNAISPRSNGWLTNLPRPTVSTPGAASRLAAAHRRHRAAQRLCSARPGRCRRRSRRRRCGASTPGCAISRTSRSRTASMSTAARRQRK